MGEGAWQDICIKLEELVVSGKHEECRKILIAHKPQKVPREWAARIGEFSSRANLPLYTLKVLQHIIYPENSFDATASSKEKMIYATALFKLGAILEAIEVLNTINSKEEPEALLYTSNAHFYNWNYVAGIPLLKEFIKAPQITPYRRLVGKINLAAAFVITSDWEDAVPLLEEISTECETNSYKLLLGNSYELKAQVELFQGRFDQALELLEKAMFYLKEQGGLYSMFVEKWMIVCRCQTNPGEVKNLQVLREKARELNHFSTVRECDLFESIITKNENLFKKVMMGTPSEFYQQRARKLFGKNLVARGQYLLFLGNSLEIENEDIPVFKGKGLAKQRQLLKLLNTLTTDFYQPFTIGNLFQSIYPDEKFNARSSPPRVLRLLRRLDSWFIESDLPLRVNFKKSEFSLTSTKSIFVVVQRGSDLSLADEQYLELKEHFADRAFSAPKVCEVLSLSKTTSNKFLREYLSSGKIVKTGQGKATLYRLANQRQKKVA